MIVYTRDELRRITTNGEEFRFGPGELLAISRNCDFGVYLTLSGSSISDHYLWEQFGVSRRTLKSIIRLRLKERDQDSAYIRGHWPTCPELSPQGLADVLFELQSLISPPPKTIVTEGKKHFIV